MSDPAGPAVSEADPASLADSFTTDSGPADMSERLTGVSAGQDELGPADGRVEQSWSPSDSGARAAVLAKGGMQQAEAALSSSSPHNADPSTSPPPPPPSIYKRKLRRQPKGILKPAPPPTKAFSFRRDILQQLNTRLAQQGLNVQVPVPHGTLAGTAQGTAQAASSLLGGMLKRVSGFAAGGLSNEEYGAGGLPTGQRSASSSNVPQSDDRETRVSQAQRTTSLSSVSSDSTLVNGTTPSRSVHAIATNNLPQPSASVRPLRKVRFTVTNMAVTYPISGAITPGEEDATRQRIEEEHRKKLKAGKEKKWSVLELEQLYRECCRTREEHPLKKMRLVFQEARQNTPPAVRTIDLSFIPLDRQAIEPVADLLSVDFGLQKLVLENCGLTDEGLKSILHALLVSGSLPSLSLASNKRIKYHGWRYVGIFMRRARALRYLDLSENNINRASLEHIIGALNKREASGTDGKEKRIDKEGSDGEETEEPLTVQAKLLSETADGAAALTSLRLENCGLKTASLEMLSHTVRSSDLCHLSLRRNRINQVGAVALALMLKDYPDNHGFTAEQTMLETSLEGESTSGSRREFGQGEDGRGRSMHPGSQSSGRSASPALPQIPVIVSSPGGGVTRRTLPTSALAALHEASTEAIVPSNGTNESAASTPEVELNRRLTDEEREQVQQIKNEQKQSDEVALALFQAQRAKQILSSMPRMGSLLTLDLKSNDIRGGVVYLSQALKKNRTLKVLNLSDNNIEVMGLVAIADALKYNSTLETLDMSHNPCSGPGLEGITTLRNAFTLNSNLKRLFLSDTELSSEGAIALAEFLPEARSLIHLDLTENLQIDIAGVMALAVSVKMNKSLRCLDLNIPPNAPDFARLSQDILSSCIRNTELAQRRAQQKGVKAPIAAPIYKSSLARAAKEKEESKRLQAANQQLEQMSSSAYLHSAGDSAQPKETDDGQTGATRITDAAYECVQVLRELLEREKEQEKERERDREVMRRADGSMATPPMSEFAQDLMTQSKHLRAKLKKALGVMQDGDALGRALQINDDLEAISAQLSDFYTGGSGEAKGLSSKDDTADADWNVSVTSPLHLEIPAKDEEGLSSPNFSIGSDDDDDEDSARPSAVSTARTILNSSADAALAGLGIEERLNIEAVTATREVPSEQDTEADVDPDTALANDRAKGQLSEEGEIFRRAKSLSIGEEDDEDGRDEEEGNDKKSPVPVASSSGSSPTISKSILSGLVRQGELVDEAVDKDDAAISVASDDRKGVTGEELRKELLETHIPRRSSNASSNGSGSAPFAGSDLAEEAKTAAEVPEEEA